MCTSVIIDTNVMGEIHKTEFLRLLDWFDAGHGFFVYATEGRYGEELLAVGDMMKLVTEYRRTEVARLVDHGEMRKAEAALDRSSLRSNDPHVLALAVAGNAEILCTRDHRLMDDFRKLLPKVSRRPRAVYPANVSDQKRRKFLDARRCRLRTSRG